MLVFILISGLMVGILSGMLGIGGGILITPILLYIPTLLGLPTLSMKAITGLTMVQGLVGSASGFLAHRRYHTVNVKLILWMGPAIIISSFMGAHLSKFLADNLLMAIFAGLALAASLLILVNRKESSNGYEMTDLHFNRPVSVIIAITVGFTGGLVGQGGSFILVPALINILGIPTRLALGSNLGIVLLSSLAGLSGKISAGLVEPLPALALIAGVIPGAQLGGFLSQRINKDILKKILAVVIVLTSLRIWWTVLEVKIIAFITSIPADLILLYMISSIGLILSIINTGLFIWLVRKHAKVKKQKEHDKAVQDSGLMM